ncbi:MAG: LemA family protein [Tissierellia bacterium]|nr:LemA family protein [Tissierellia bacterium]
MLYIFIIIAILVVYFISAQRKFISLDEINKNALSQIGVQQDARWNALMNLVKAAKSYAEFERDTLSEIISKRANIGNESSADEVNRQENMITEAISRIVAVAERYPELKSSEHYKMAMESINTYEDDVKMSKMVYNDTVTKWNRLTRQFPSSIVASILGFKSKSYLETAEEKKEYPDLEF